jgi:hypothetical protein
MFNRFLVLAAVAVVVAASPAWAALCCTHNACSPHEALHGTIVHKDLQSAGPAHGGKGHCTGHGHEAAPCTDHKEKTCNHDLPHNSYCAKNCSAHASSPVTACGNDHQKDCGDHLGNAGCQRHACSRDCDAAAQKCAHCGHSHCGDHAWKCHTTHHHTVATHSCNHNGCRSHCHTDGLRQELRGKVEEVRWHAQNR